ncbi:tRNA (adenosine(37)-N6)-threonylcarbamoyltransferase complex ATPase subunit type 1 TsaE [Arthrobacter sp. 35W]|uniref:tRNA (adenosine(37)-N6)-threonylcarbamoyltransferase complex ATPase subunit type 1 TsaE n=1 Tax=Arthrobacter sp. 35W TaxID=1132441 RepID=UPI00041AE7A6|nr:tRNA (adenosine(37)-N6)-threonylcarbamoyltransferase complex ATPase subunit type 1 TsaE [Arthrobacter sp. 35W]
MSPLVEFSTSSAAETQHIAHQLGALLRAGDLLILSGGLGAGKTTFTQGLGHGLGVRPGIISPTFVLVRIHPNLAEGHNPGGPDLVHVDAYRLGSAAEIDDIDLENTLDGAVTVVEWGADRVEHLAESRLEIELVRATGADDHASTQDTAAGHDTSNDFSHDFSEEEGGEDEARIVRIRAVGPRWEGVDLSGLAEENQRPSGVE